MTNMIYPGTSSSISNETIFIDGIRFDICEVAPSHYEYLAPNTAKGSSKPSGRFFLAVEEAFVVNYSLAVDYHKKTGECRYDFFCCSKSDCMTSIKQFEEAYTYISKAAPKTEEGLSRLSGKKKWMLDRFGVKL